MYKNFGNKQETQIENDNWLMIKYDKNDYTISFQTTQF